MHPSVTTIAAVIISLFFGMMALANLVAVLKP